MPYIFHYDHNFVFVDGSKNGVYCQTFSPAATTKPIFLPGRESGEYSAYLSEDHKLYVATMPDEYHLNYFTLDNNKFNRNSLVRGGSSNYKLSNPLIYTINNKPNIIYLSNKVQGGVYDFVFQNLASPEVTTLYSLFTKPQNVKYYVHDMDVYIFYIENGPTTELRALKVTPTDVIPISYVQSQMPITDYSIYLDGDDVNITYVTETYGKYQLFFSNPAQNVVNNITTTITPPKPVIFNYFHALWINAIIDKKLNMLISMDGGRTFSMPVPCSYQTNLCRSKFYSENEGTLVADEIFATIASKMKLCIVGKVDVDHIHSDNAIAPELELLLEALLMGIRQSNGTTSQITQQQLEQLKQLQQVQEQMQHQQIQPERSRVLIQEEDKLDPDLNNMRLPTGFNKRRGESQPMKRQAPRSQNNNQQNNQMHGQMQSSQHRSQMQGGQVQAQQPYRQKQTSSRSQMQRGNMGVGQPLSQNDYAMRGRAEEAMQQREAAQGIQTQAEAPMQDTAAQQALAEDAMMQQIMTQPQSNVQPQMQNGMQGNMQQPNMNQNIQRPTRPMQTDSTQAQQKNINPKNVFVDSDLGGWDLPPMV